MKFSVVLALIAVVSLPLCKAIPLDTRNFFHRLENIYHRLESADASCAGADLVHGGTKDIQELKALCDQMEGCQGFHSNGMLKKDVSVGCQDNDLAKGAALYVRSVDNPAVIGMPIVPLPRSLKLGSGVATVQLPIAIQCQGGGAEAEHFMQDAAKEMSELIVTHQANQANPGLGLNVVVETSDMQLSLSTDESYELSVTEANATITARTVFGARHGLETFSQLVQFDFKTNTYVIRSVPVHVEDVPRFAHRGILLDTARHYHSLPVMKKFIRSLGHAKLNVFHWHLVDNQAFPIQLRSLPRLVMGAFSPLEVYTPDDVVEIVQYAYRHGVRVIPEYDTPGHAKAWCVGHPEICPSVECNLPLNPATEATFNLLSTLIKESTGMFTDDYFHLGGDEVDMKCWLTTPSIKAWMVSKNFSTDDAYKYFVARTHALAKKLGRKSVHWEEVFNHFGGELDKDTIFQVWLNHDTAAKVVAKGYQTIISNQEAWYLDHLKITWQQAYVNDPFMGITDPAQQKLVLGGEACMWGETVDDSDIFNTIWPRAAGAAERLWSDASVKDTDAFLPRLEAFRCLLTSRGIGAAPVLNTMARLAPPHPGSCFSQ